VRDDGKDALNQHKKIERHRKTVKA